MKNRWTKIAFAILLVIPLAWLTNRELRDTANKRRASEIVLELGGKVGSLPTPIPFFGEELRYEFHGTQFGSSDISRLAILQRLSEKHWVGIMFKDTSLDQSDMIRIRQMLPDCHPFRVNNGERLPD